MFVSATLFTLQNELFGSFLIGNSLGLLVFYRRKTLLLVLDLKPEELLTLKIRPFSLEIAIEITSKSFAGLWHWTATFYILYNQLVFDEEPFITLNTGRVEIYTPRHESIKCIERFIIYWFVNGQIPLSQTFHTCSSIINNLLFHR